jgi:DNA-binding HxlR family transcriptional regulator
MKRTYRSQAGCPVAGTLELIGERWTCLIVRDLTMGRSGKFNDLLESLEGISTNLLSQRLKELEQAGIVERHMYSDHPPRAEYTLTQKGEELLPLMAAISKWGVKHALTEEQRSAPDVVAGLQWLEKRLAGEDARLPDFMLNPRE